MNFYSILFMDIRGYSELTPDDKEKVHQFLSNFENEVKQFKSTRGEPECEVPLHFFNTWGDAVIALFNDANNAMGGFENLKSKFNELQRNLKNHSLLMRVVMHWGKVYQLSSGSFFGDEIITAARIEPLVEPGEVWLTEEFKKEVEKDQFLMDRYGSKIDEGSLYLLPKGWGIKKLYKLKNANDIEGQTDKTNYLEIKFTWKNDHIIMEPIRERDISTDPFTDDERASMIKNMPDFLIRKIDFINTYCAIGIQNFLELDKMLCVGARMKTNVNKELPRYKLIAKQAFNTGYKLIREMDNFPKDAHAPLDLFKRPQQQPGQELLSEHIEEIHKKGISIYKIKLGGTSLSCLVFINYSYVCPRYEIGICRFHKAETKNIKQGEHALPDFGADEHSKAEGTYWIWVREGQIKAFSFYSIRGIEGEKILLLNSLSNALNTPFISCERFERKTILNELFSSPARAVLERF